MSKKILIMGLPGSGKTTLATELAQLLQQYGVVHLNADEVRKKYDDWDFSIEGRIRQARRMKQLSDEVTDGYVIADFVCPLQKMRDIYRADWTIWVDTIEYSIYKDTNTLFNRPDSSNYDFRIIEKNAKVWAQKIAHRVINNVRYDFHWQHPTVQMLGRWQPWHKGHRALFERAIAKTGQVAIFVRDCHDEKNPFSFEEVEDRIRKDLDSEYNGRYIVRLVPNIVNITYGRDVGYKIEQETFDESITSISATKIRKEMGL